MTNALFIGGPWDNRIVSLRGNPRTFFVRTLRKTHRVWGSPIGVYEVDTDSHEYWQVPDNEGSRTLYIYVDGRFKPKRITHTLAFTSDQLRHIGIVINDLVNELLSRGGDPRTISIKTTMENFGPPITYKATVESYLVPTYDKEN